MTMAVSGQGNAETVSYTHLDVYKRQVGFRDGGNALLQVVRNVQEILLVRLIPGLCVPGLKDFA